MAYPRQGATNFNILQMNGTVEKINSISITTLQADQDGNILLAVGTTLPTDGSAGYAKGATFLLTTAATGVSGSYQNIGTITSSIFALVGPSSAGAITGLVAKVSLSSAQILGLNASPVLVLPDSGVGRIYVIEQIIFKMITTGTAYANGGAVEFRYTNAAGAKVTGADLAATVVTAAAGTSYTVLGGNSAANVTAQANTTIIVDNATAPFTNGTGTATITVKYSIITP